MPKSSEKKQSVPVNFQIKGIELLESCMNHPKSALPELRNFQFNLKLEHKVNTDIKFIAVVVSIEVFDEKHETKFGSLAISCIYGIDNFENFVDSKKNLNLPDDILITLNSISLSTARGIMFSQFKGTFLHAACLPIIDPKSFVLQKVVP